MRLTIRKEILRRNSAYKTARSILDAFFFVNIIAWIVAAVAWSIIVWHRNADSPEWMTALIISGIIFAAGLLIALSYLQNELTHVFFDIADCLLNPEGKAGGENPFDKND